MKDPETHYQVIHRGDYKPFPYHVSHVDIDFNLAPDRTVVKSRQHYERRLAETDKAADPESIFLNGEGIELLSLTMEGRALVEGEDYSITPGGIQLYTPPESFTLEVETAIAPSGNTTCAGLYISGGIFCTQCEPESFRTMTFYPDRPDILATFKTRIEADETCYPVLLSNGNPVESGTTGNGRHYAVWEDPFPKPSYLFALVAGDLACLQDSFTTMSGRVVDLRIYVMEADLPYCEYAMISLKQALEWDEQVYNREYQLDRFNIVAVSDFNMGAMENTSLNIFNTAAFLVDPDTATDQDYLRVQAIVAHEFFHTWSGNRVTLRDWFQLSLKEGLTVFREQQFCADMNDSALQRIQDIKKLRFLQYPEDDGPLAHPVRPDSYVEINNFYSMTIYEKGAELLRMLHTLLGPEAYYRGTDLYFSRFDGQAVTCDDFIACMEDVSGLDLTQFKLWYAQAGRPCLSVTDIYDEQSETYSLTFRQSLPSTPLNEAPTKMHEPMVIPVRMGFFNSRGTPLQTGTGETNTVALIDKGEQTLEFTNIPEKPVPSFLRGFSAPVDLDYLYDEDGLATLILHDTDGFNRWEMLQRFIRRDVTSIADRLTDNDRTAANEKLINIFGQILDEAGCAIDEKHASYGFYAEMLSVPDLASIMPTVQAPVDPGALHAGLSRIELEVGQRFYKELMILYEKLELPGTYSADPASIGMRALKNTALRLLAHASEDESEVFEMVYRQFSSADNMNDRQAALTILSNSDSRYRDQALDDFYKRYSDNANVIHKWFSIQATAVRSRTLDDVENLLSHEDFTYYNPNRVRALLMGLGLRNPACFHDPGGRGYRILAESIIKLDRINPQIAAQMFRPFNGWLRLSGDRQDLVRKALDHIAAQKDLSADVYEVVTKSLASDVRA